MSQNKFETHPIKTLVLIFIIFLVFSIFGAEMFLYMLPPEENREVQKGISRSIRLREHSPSAIKFIKPTDEYIKKTDSLKKKEFRFEIDGDGYIQPSVVHKKPDVTVFFIGGSTTECIYVDEENRFPYLVGRLLEKDNIKVNSINSGVSGNNSMHSINIFLNKGIKLSLDFAIMMHNINDLNVLIYEDSYWNNNQSKSLVILNNVDKYIYFKGVVNIILPNWYKILSKVKNRFFNKSKGDEFHHIRGNKKYIDKQGILKKFERNLQVFIDISRAHDIIPVLMTQANRFKKIPDKIIIENWNIEKDFGITYEKYRNIYIKMNELIRQVGIDNNVFVIDLASEVPQSASYMYDVVHFNRNGSKYVSVLIANKLSGLISKLKIE